jgi:hypothetical protein
LSIIIGLRIKPQQSSTFRSQKGKGSAHTGLFIRRDAMIRRRGIVVSEDNDICVG